jgi:hypothetical protein
MMMMVVVVLEGHEGMDGGVEARVGAYACAVVGGSMDRCRDTWVCCNSRAFYVPRFALGNSGDVLLYLGTYVSLAAGTTDGLKLHIFYHRNLLWAFLTSIIAHIHVQYFPEVLIFRQRCCLRTVMVYAPRLRNGNVAARRTLTRTLYRETSNMYTHCFCNLSWWRISSEQRILRSLENLLCSHRQPCIHLHQRVYRSSNHPYMTLVW